VFVCVWEGVRRGDERSLAILALFARRISRITIVSACHFTLHRFPGT